MPDSDSRHAQVDDDDPDYDDVDEDDEDDEGSEDDEEEEEEGTWQVDRRGGSGRSLTLCG